MGGGTHRRTGMLSGFQFYPTLAEKCPGHGDKVGKDRLVSGGVCRNGEEDGNASEERSWRGICKREKLEIFMGQEGVYGA